MTTCSAVYHDPCAVRGPGSDIQPEGKRRALFLDRDGVINRDTGYVHTESETRFLPGIFGLCSAAQRAGWSTIVITNQAGIARGLYSETDFLKYTAWVHAEFAKRSVRLLATYYCPHHPQVGNPPYVRNCDCRKPKPGMLLQALQDYAIDPMSSVLIGDKTGDIEAGVAAAVGTCLLLGSEELPPAGRSRVARIASVSSARRYFRRPTA